MIRQLKLMPYSANPVENQDILNGLQTLKCYKRRSHFSHISLLSGLPESGYSPPHAHINLFFGYSQGSLHPNTPTISLPKLAAIFTTVAPVNLNLQSNIRRQKCPSSFYTGFPALDTLFRRFRTNLYLLFRRW